MQSPRLQTIDLDGFGLNERSVAKINCTERWFDVPPQKVKGGGAKSLAIT